MMEPIRITSEVVVDPGVGQPWFEGGPLVVYDGLGLETEREEPVIRLSCAACGSGIPVGLRAVLSSRSLGRQVSEPWVEELASSFGLTIRDFDELRIISDPLGLSPYPVQARCPSCSASNLVMIGYGEYQPTRYLATCLGVALVE